MLGEINPGDGPRLWERVTQLGSRLVGITISVVFKPRTRLDEDEPDFCCKPAMEGLAYVNVDLFEFRTVVSGIGPEARL